MRREDWPERLAGFVDSRRNMDFAYGSNDCALFAADAIREMTGSDPLADLRGRWTTARGAARLLNKMGGLRAAATSLLGDEIAPAFAQRGDVVLLPNEGRECLGICTGLVAAAPGATGIVWLPMSAAVAAWRV